MITYEKMEELTYEEIQKTKSRLWPKPFDIELASVSSKKRLVAEGDSWFDYPPGLDILDNLKLNHRYMIYKVAEAGDTIDNMIYGTEIRSNFSRKPSQFLETLNAIERHKPKVFLFSGGGNDVAGEEFINFLNHKDAGLNPLKDKFLGETLDYFKIAYQYMINQVLKIDKKIHIITHGYGYSIPDGRAVINFPLNLRFVGPWLRPALARKNYLSVSEGELIVKQLIDRFNDMLADLDDKNENFHYIDLRNEIKKNDWANELHLKSSKYKRVAKIFHNEIQKYV